MYDPYSFCIYTDGNAYKNPGGPGGIAGVIEYPPDEKWKKPEKIFGAGYFKTTNNRMELKAVIEALQWIHKNKKKLGFPGFIIYSDSKYVVDNQFRAQDWRKMNWHTHNNKPVHNHRLWREFLSIRTKESVPIKRVLGKSSDPTLLVDRLAKSYGETPTLTDLGFLPGLVSKSRMGKGRAELFPANGQICTINHYAERPINKAEYEVKFDLFSIERECYTAKYKAYVSNKLIHLLHRGNHFDVQFNDNPKYPVILEISENLDL